MLSCSVVITTRNSDTTIGRCLESLMPYVHSGDIKEIIVVDGHSTDKTAEIIRSFPVMLIYEEGTEAYEKSVIRHLYSTYHALDLGWQKATGDLIMFLDSDAYLGENFFPFATILFDNDKLGIIGGWAKPGAFSQTAATMGQLWQFHGERIAALQNGANNWFEMFYQYVVWFGNKRIYTSGPCYIARRKCIESVGGHDIHADVGLCLHIIEAGWKSYWWIEAPIYHMPTENLSALWRQRYAWGLNGAFMQGNGWHHHLSLPVRIAGSFVLGTFLAIRFRNTWHFLVLPTAEIGHLSGYFAGIIAKAQGKK